MSCRLAIRSADGNVHCDHARSSEDDCPGPVGCEADMTCVSKQRPQTDVACTRWSLYEGTWCLQCENRRTCERLNVSERRSHWTRGGSRDAERLADVHTLHGLHVFN